MIIPAIIYIAWDIIFTRLGVWSFNPAYVSGLYISNLPLEEILFFFVVPYCCVFIYECIHVYFPGIKNSLLAQTIFVLIALISLFIGVFHLGQLYTSVTFISCGSFMLFVYFWRKSFFKKFNFSLFLVSYSVILIPFLIINGFLTSIPVVLYNNVENMAARIFTIPVEDLFYGMLLILMNIVLLERLRPAFIKSQEKK